MKCKCIIKMLIISNRVSRSSLKPGDHIYTWRTGYCYAHHGIYIGDNRVIHFRRQAHVVRRTMIDLTLGAEEAELACPTCGSPPKNSNAVFCTCLDCFLWGGCLYLFEYDVSPARFLAKLRGGTYTLADSDPLSIVLHRAKLLLKTGFGCYSLFKNNCEDFAIYCKTGLFVEDEAGSVGRSGQSATVIGGYIAAALSTPLCLFTNNVYVMAAAAVGVYFASRYVAEIGRKKMEVEDLIVTKKLGTGSTSTSVLEHVDQGAKYVSFRDNLQRQDNLPSLLKKDGLEERRGDLRERAKSWGCSPTESAETASNQEIISIRGEPLIFMLITLDNLVEVLEWVIIGEGPSRVCSKGIYVGDNSVIHFTRRGQEVGTGTVLDLLLVSSGPARSQVHCPTCTPPEEGNGVFSSCLDCFLSGGILYRFEYAVSPALFLAKARGGTCTLAVSDPEDIVVHRAKFLLDNGFGCYNVFKNNCEDFAIYCKTGLLVVDQVALGRSGQAVSIIGGPLAAVLSTPLRLVTTNVYGMVATAVGVYCASRYAADIGMRRDVVKVEVEDLTRRLATGLLQVVEPSMAALPAPAQ
ncbi:LRAT domain [Dillenia turbinata]|uniref:LRAT domain n=1 Tax=Dillenia turbinata TaxID=194707 RepID=A0AAN8VX56_9MAGN